MSTFFISETTQKLLKGNKTHRRKVKQRDLRVNILEPIKQMNWWSLPRLIRESWILVHSKDSLEIASSHCINSRRCRKVLFKVRVLGVKTDVVDSLCKSLCKIQLELLLSNQAARWLPLPVRSRRLKGCSLERLNWRESELRDIDSEQQSVPFWKQGSILSEKILNPLPHSAPRSCMPLF